MSTVTSALSATLRSEVERASSERSVELQENLSEIRTRVSQASTASRLSSDEPLLIAVSKYKPASDIITCYEAGQRHFGENYVQELVEKAKTLPPDIRWHFIGTFQTNKSKILAGIPNLHCLQTLSSVKAADALDKALASASRPESSPLNVLIQVNTSGEGEKGGLSPLLSEDIEERNEGGRSENQLLDLALHVIRSCPRLHLQGLMTIGSLSESLSHSDANRDFARLVETRNALQSRLLSQSPLQDQSTLDEGTKIASWGIDGKLLLSMGMSSDFEAALRAGSDIVRVGTGIFGQRHKKGE